MWWELQHSFFFFWGGFFVRSATDIYNWVARQKWSLFLNSPKSSHGKNLGFLHKRTGQMVKWVGSLKTSSVLLWFLPFLFFSFPLKRQNFKEFLFFLPQSLKRSFFNNTTNKQTDFFFCKVRKKKMLQRSVSMVCQRNPLGNNTGIHRNLWDLQLDVLRYFGCSFLTPESPISISPQGFYAPQGI